jgi:hypothetical protein
MKKTLFAFLSLAAALLAARAEDNSTLRPPLTIMPPPVPTGAQIVYVYDQKPLAGMPALITPQQAQAIVDQFKTNYAKLGSPRILIYINRDLVDEQSGMKLSGRSEQVDTTSTSSGSAASTNGAPAAASVTTHVTAQNNYENNGQPAQTLTDRQTVRDVERLMGRPMRSAGATLVDQHVAAQLIGDRQLGSITTDTDQARKDREAVGKIADVVVEVLISSRNVTVPGVAGDKIYTVPDIQMTAIRLSDAKVIGQVAASDVMNRAGGAGYAARNFGVEAITEATALALMDDMQHGL